jgi:hypothetical protein
MPKGAGARGRRTRGAPPLDAGGRVDIAPPQIEVTVSVNLPLELHHLLEWVARRYETTVDGYLFDLVQDDLLAEVERYERDHAGGARRRA